MTSSPLYSPLVAGLLLAVAAGCGGSRAKTETTKAPPPRGSDIAASDIAEHPTQSPEELLRGRISGVNVVQSPDGGISVRIRGGSSAFGNNEPLYIVDGMPFEPGPNGVLSGIQVTDIESIKVLKDAADITMYGVRGANGVIVITTKKGKPNR